MKKYLLKFLVWAVLAGLCYATGVLVLRQIPRKMPTQPVAMRSTVRTILAEKCAACHDSTRGCPFYGKIPGLVSLIGEERRKALRHWEPGNRNYLGPKATEGQKLDAPTPLAVLAKLENVLLDNSMPPHPYLIIHWGTWLSHSEKAILQSWCNVVRHEWLEQWGITNNTEKIVQPIPEHLPFHAEKAALGEKLFHDKRLSADESLSCASCHQLEKGGADGIAMSKGIAHRSSHLNTPTVLNAVFNLRQSWDGRAADLAEQAKIPVVNPVMMGCTNWTQVISRLAEDAPLKASFTAVYPEGFTERTISNAIAEYGKRLITPGARFDRYLKGHKTVFSHDEDIGYKLFRQYSCTRCHAGPTLGGQSFEYADLKDNPFKGRILTEGDAGLQAFSGYPEDAHRFKVPTLRNVALTAPYLHDGSKNSLVDAVASMLTYQLGIPYTEDDVRAVAAFLHTLTGELFGKPLAKE